MGEVRPVQFERLGARQVEWNNLLESRRISLPVQNGAGSNPITFRTISSPAVSGPIFHARAGELSVGLAIGEAELRALYPDGVADVSLAQLPPPLGLALGETALRPVFEQLSTCLGVSLAFDGTTDTIPDDWQPVALDAVVDGSKRPMAVLYLNAEAERALKAFLDVQPAAAKWTGADDAAVPVSILLPTVGLSLNERKALRSGSIILLPPDTEQDRFRVCVGAGLKQVGFCKLAENNNVILEQFTDGIMTGDNENDIDPGEEVEIAAPEPEEAELEEEAEPEESEPEEEAAEADELEPEEEAAEPDGSEETGAPEEAEEAAPSPAPESGAELGEPALEGVEVYVDFALGRKTMTFAELQELSPGTVIDLGKPVSQAVNILASGRAIGDGEIVQIDDRLGVRILRLIGRDDD